MDISLDVSEFTAMLKGVEKEIDRTPRNVLKVAKSAAAHLRATDWYQNRTGDLRASTQATEESAGVIVLTMGMPYASFVYRLGFSDWGDVSEQAREHVRSGAQAALDKAAG